MRPRCFSVRRLSIYVVVMLLSAGSATLAIAQSQEPKPALPATPVAQPASPASGEAATGVSGSSWQGPNFGVRVQWDPAVWSVEGESIDEGYDGLQIGTPSSTVFLEAYNGFAGDAEACFAAAEQEIGEREGISEVVPLADQPQPVAAEVRGAAGLFGLTATLPDGTPYRGVEYVECRTVKPGEAVLEITWQSVTQAFNEDFANVEGLLATIEIPQESPSATPVAPRATPVA
ncbi:MAG: hypothetical protein K0Q89_2534 [Thermomicrobiales bacterium]|nr:hypothetical protein [Thermomicrobiales bacterium]